MKMFHLVHDWTKWKDIKEGPVHTGERLTGFYITQERRCIVCGKVQLREARD